MRVYAAEMTGTEYQLPHKKKARWPRASIPAMDELKRVEGILTMNELSDYMYAGFKRRVKMPLQRLKVSQPSPVSLG